MLIAIICGTMDLSEALTFMTAEKPAAYRSAARRETGGKGDVREKGVVGVG